MGARMRDCPRLSRIYYRGRFFKYPLEPFDALRNLGPLEATRCLFSYLYMTPLSKERIRSFEDWVVSAFGRRLYEIFFRTYTEKVWGIPCAEISADWAAQRIRGLSLASVMRNLVRPARNGAVIKTLVDHFRYPAQGPGEMWEKVTSLIGEEGGTVSMGQAVVALQREPGRVVSVTTQGADGRRTHCADRFISTMPLADLIASLDPPAPQELVAKARQLRYRDFITVALVLDEAEVFPDNWIYIHDSSVQVGRIQNYKQWSAEMVPDPRLTVLGLEYFCTEHDALWSASDEQLIETAKNELAQLGLADKSRVVDATVVRQPKAYPLYDHEYRTTVDQIRTFLELECPNLQVAGRNGMHKYNNQDHAMMTGLMAARNIMGSSFDLWRVNSDAEYLETEERGSGESGRAFPTGIDDTGEVWGIPALDVVSARSGYIGAAGWGLLFDLLSFRLLVHYCGIWYPISFAISCLIGAAVDHSRRQSPPGLSLWQRAMVVAVDGGDCYLINIGLMMVFDQFLKGNATLSRILTAIVITMLTFIRQNLLSRQRRHALVAAELKGLR